jgi:ankyrin repeat protein
LSDDNKTTLLYLSCGGTTKGALGVDDVCHTLLYQLYSLAREDENNVKLLEDCNNVFANRKAKNIGKVISQSSKDEKLPEFVDAFLAIAELLKINVFIALDEVDSLPSPDQKQLATRLKAIVTPSEPSTGDSSVKMLIGCRSGTDFQNQMQSTDVDVGDYNKDDIVVKLSGELKKIPGLTEDEQEEAIKAIAEKAGPRFTYANDIAVPFMREPFQRPLSRRLEALPEGMNNIYNEALRKMGSNYVDLLHTALKWTLLAPVPLSVDEIMDAYHGTYNGRGPEFETKARNLTDVAFGKAPALEIEQLRNASGPFLRLEQTSLDSDYIVTLRDAPLVKEFCLHSPDADISEHHKDGEICSRCKSALAESKTLAISPKEAHLELALQCLRHLNNPVFQRRATSHDAVSMWSFPEKIDGLHTNGGTGALDDHGVIEASEVKSPQPEAKQLDSKDIGDTLEGNGRPDADKPSDNNEPVQEKHEDAEQNNDEGYDSDDSLDMEDVGAINLARVEAETEEEVADNNVETRQLRYELLYWSYHILMAEKLWTPEERVANKTWRELMDELDCFVSDNLPFFQWWKNLDEITAEDCKGFKSLHIAASFELTSWAEHLLKNGADPNELSDGPSRMNSVRAAAIDASSRPMLKLLLENGADPNMGEVDTLPAFHAWILSDSSLESVQLMLEHGADPTMCDEMNRWTALHHFAWQGTDVKALDLLLEHSVNGVKPDINVLDENEYSPLHILLWRREVPKELLRAFLARGADVNRDNNHSIRPLQMASLWGELETLQILCEGQTIAEIDDDDNDGDSALQQAAIGNHAKCLHFLAELGANVNMQNKRGRVAIHNSALQGAKNCVEILLAHGAQVNIVDKHNRTPLMFACSGKSLETAELLLDTLLDKKVPVAEISQLTKRRRTILRQAASNGLDVIVDRLIKAAQEEDDVASLFIDEADTRKGMTALHRASWFGHTKCVKHLLAANADTACKDLNGKTALVLAYEQWMLASHQSAFEDIISLLIANDPKAARADAELVAICAMNGSTRLLKQLCELGADLNQQDRYGWTPLDLARKFHQESAGQFLKQQAAWAGMLPSQWAQSTRTNITENGTGVIHTSDERVCVSTDKPLPAGLDTFYFEVTSKVLDDNVAAGVPEWAIGFCTIGGQSIEFPGWPFRVDAPSAMSWGYHADNGGLYHSGNKNGTEVATERSYAPGDTVGCGVDLTTGKLWFTRNGEKLESGFDNVRGRVFPLLGLHERVELETNFKGPFMWKEEKEKEQTSTP